jgi:hypothetical protein
MTDDDFDYWAVEFSSREDLKAAYAHIAISAETSPYVALVAETAMDEDDVRAALAPMAAQGVPFTITHSEISREDMWPEFPEDSDEDEIEDDALSP